MRVGLRLEGLDAYLATLDGLPLQIKLNLTVALEWFGNTATQEMITQHSFQNRTGRLERSIGYLVEVVDGNLQLQIFALAPYASAVEEGVEGHSRPYPFFWPVFYKWLPDLYARLGEAVDTAFEDARDTGRVHDGLA